MTEQEYLESKAKLAEAQVQLDAWDMEQRDLIARSQALNDQRRVVRNQSTGLSQAMTPIRNAVAEYERDQRMAQAEKAKADAEARAKEPKPPTQLDLLTKEVAELKAALAAKG